MPHDYVAGISGALARFLHETSKLVNEQSLPPFPPESLAAIEAAKPESPSLDTVVTLPQGLIESGGEHLGVFVEMIAEPVRVIAACTCVRSMLEPCALAAWILDPRIDAFVRVGRVFALRYEGMVQQRKAARALGATEADVAPITKRIDEVEQDALALRYPAVRYTNGRIRGIGQPMPVTTDLIESVLGEEAIYRTLSAVAHGHNWAIMQLCYKAAGPEGRFTKFEKTVSIEGLTWQGLVAAKSLGRALWHRCLYLGGDRENLKELLESTLDAFGAQPKARFWRSGYDL